MNKRIQTVMSILKPKVKAFGFNKKELQGVAAKIADNLTSDEDASDEDVNAEIEKAIEAVIPILEFGQSYANRVINDSKKNETKDDDDEEDDDDVNSKSTKSSKSKRKDDMPEWAKAILQSNESLKSELAAIKGEKLMDSRKSRLEHLLKDTGTFGARTLKSFTKMKFESDDDFDEFYAEIEEDLKSLNQERANAGLGKLGAPATGGSTKKSDEKEVLSDDEIKAIAAL